MWKKKKTFREFMFLVIRMSLPAHLFASNLLSSDRIHLRLCCNHTLPLSAPLIHAIDTILYTISHDCGVIWYITPPADLSVDIDLSL